MTEWRDIPSYAGFYQASDDGRVRSVDRVVPRSRSGRTFMVNRKGKELASLINKSSGYRVVSLSHNGKRRTGYIHSLVLEAFVGPRPEGMDGCHRDGNRDNNAVANLYWGSRVQNVADTVRHGTAAWLTRTHCPNGHLYTNATEARRRSVYGHGTIRKCRICEAATRRRYLLRKQAGLVGAAS